MLAAPGQGGVVTDDDIVWVKGDDGPTRRERRRQSDYRREVLAVDPGLHDGEPLGSLLPAGERRRNFLSDEAARYAEARVAVVQREGGMLDEARLFENMLSSMPLAFNVFGHLRARPEAGVRLLSTLLDVHLLDLVLVAVGNRLIAGVECEWAPDRREHLRDGTAFDAVAAARTADGRRLLVSVEVKYVDRFSRDRGRRHDKTEKYRSFCDEFGMAEGARDLLEDDATRQLLRNVLLTESVRRSGAARPAIDEAVCVVFAREDDQRARDAVEQVRAQRGRMPTDVRFLGHGRLADAAAGTEGLADWASAFGRRYLGRT
jgi:hypothetical protein